jgi:glycosyltransferase involved in cell wall biosynthesis
MVATEGPPVHSGIAHTIGYLRDGLRARGHRIDLLAYPKVPRLIFGEARFSALLFRLPGLARRLDDYDIIHLHGATPTVSDIFLIFAAIRGRRPPLVYTHHCDVELSLGGPFSTLYNALHDHLSATADHVVKTTFGYATRLRQNGGISTIPLGVDFDRFATDESEDPQFTVLFVGQFRRYKGVPVLLRAMAQVPGARLLIAGAGDQERVYRALAATLGIEVEFHINPDDDQLRRLYQRARVLTLPSLTRAEAFGLVLLEGMAAGCVPVASDLPGVCEVLKGTGFTFPAGSVEGLAGALCRLRDDVGLVEQSSSLARRRASDFSWEQTISEYERLFTEMVASRKPRHWLADRQRSGTPALQAFVSQAVQELSADQIDVFVYTGSNDIRSVARSNGPMAKTNSRPAQVITPLARYTCETGQSVLLTSGSAPEPLVELIAKLPNSAMAAPVQTNGRVFGALVAMRERQFDQHELHSLVRLARSAVPILIATEEPRISCTAADPEA